MDVRRLLHSPATSNKPPGQAELCGRSQAVTRQREAAWELLEYDDLDAVDASAPCLVPCDP